MENISNVRLVPLPDSPYVKPIRFLFTQNGVEKNWDLLGVHDSVAIIIFNVTRRVLVLVKQFRPAMYYNSVHPDDREDVIDTIKYPASLGIALEVCAGIIDKNKSVLEIAREEVLEECGYDVPADKMEKIISYRSGVGVQAALQTLFICEVTDEMKTERGQMYYLVNQNEKDGTIKFYSFRDKPYFMNSDIFSWLNHWEFFNKTWHYSITRRGGVDEELIEVVEKSIPEVRAMMASRGPLPSPPSFLFAMMWFLHHRASRYISDSDKTTEETR